MIIGYTTGVFDVFHIGHLNIIKRAKSLCDKLIVGVTTDKYVFEYKGIKPIVPFEERIQIIESLKYVDCVIPQENHDKFDAWNKIHFNIVFVGDDWYKTEKWNKIEKEFAAINVKIIYLPRTNQVSSTLRRKQIL